MPVDLLGEPLGVEMLGNGVSIVTWGVIMMTKRMMAMRMVQVLDAWGLARGTPWGGNVGEWGKHCDMGGDYDDKEDDGNENGPSA